MTDIDDFKYKKREFKKKSSEISDDLDKCEYTGDMGKIIYYSN